MPFKRRNIAISLGDPNGIGPEIILKSLQRKDISEQFTPVIFAPTGLINFYKKHFGINLSTHQTDDVKRLKKGKVNIVNLPTQFKVTWGESTSEGGALAYQSLKAASDAVKSGDCDYLVTSPINKHNIQSSAFNFPGHTEFLEHEWGGNALMFMIHNDLKVALVTQHLPLQKVADELNKKLIQHKIRSLQKTLQADFQLAQPKIAVLGINPHAGDQGLLGAEENEVIIPAIKEMLNQGGKVFGPFAADSFFQPSKLINYDAILAIYHDQGLIPFKTLAGIEGVNYTAGLNFVRTSPDHGVAFDIAGKGDADETSMVEAIYWGATIHKHRSEYTELKANTLEIQQKGKRDN